MRSARFLALVFALVFVAACSSSRGPRLPALELADAPSPVADVPGFKDRLWQDGRVWLAGQPTRASLVALQERGLTTIVNLRTPREMADTTRVRYDEAAFADSLGLTYVRIPLGGNDFPYTPAAVDSFAAVMARHPGPLLLHCTSGGRATYLWVAYLVDRQDWPLAEACRRGEQLGWGPDPLTALLGRRLRTEYAD